MKRNNNNSDLGIIIQVIIFGMFILQAYVAFFCNYWQEILTMNNVRRKRITNVITNIKAYTSVYSDKLGELQADIDSIIGDEQEALDNMPESLMDSDRYTTMESAVEALQSALDAVDELSSFLSESIDSVTESLEEAKS